MTATRWEEYDVAELGRLMIQAHDLEDAIGEIGLMDPTEAEREDLTDARYYAYKLSRILSRLAITAQREWREADSAADEGRSADQLMVRDAWADNFGKSGS